MRFFSNLLFSKCQFLCFGLFHEHWTKGDYSFVLAHYVFFAWFICYNNIYNKPKEIHQRFQINKVQRTNSTIRSFGKKKKRNLFWYKIAEESGGERGELLKHSGLCRKMSNGGREGGLRGVFRGCSKVEGCFRNFSVENRSIIRNTNILFPSFEKDPSSASSAPPLRHRRGLHQGGELLEVEAHHGAG